MDHKKILILKTGAYNPIKGKLPRYEGLELVTLHQYSPGIISAQEVLQSLDLSNLSKTTHILHSNARRTQETAMVIAKHLILAPKIISNNYLNEIKFSLKALVSKEGYEREGSNLVRQRFVEAFEQDVLLEKRAAILTRIKGLGKLLQQLQTRKQIKIVCVSHSFFMKILQIYLKDKRLFEKPEILREYFNPCKRTFEFCRGFEFNPKKLL